MITLLSLLLTASAAEYRTPEEVLATFSNEPEVREVQRMTEDYAKTDPSYVDAWMNASKSAALLPQLTLQGEYKDKWRNDGYYVDGDGDGVPDDDASANYVTDSGYDEYYYKLTGKARWDLNELVMSSERIRVISEAQDIVKLRDKILEDVTRTYFERRKLQCDMLLNPGDMKAQLKNELRLQELTAQLDAYTGGRFSKSIKKQ